MKESEFDEGKVAQMSATFAVTIFLSLTLLFSRNEESYVLLEKFLWTASGFFFAASMRLVDRVFDHDKDFDVIFTLVTFRGRSLFSIDERWKDGSFPLYFMGWLFFFCAFFYVGMSIFTGDFPGTFTHAATSLFSSIWLGSMFVVMSYATISSVTREFLFRN